MFVIGVLGAWFATSLVAGAGFAAMASVRDRSTPGY